ncbi:MAG: YlmC/YmxH family sporulation protein [Bacillota bacterium]
MIKTSDLRQRDVINILDGRRLGMMSDIEVDLENGRVTAIIVPGPGRVLGLFARDADYVIPWRSIRKIGIDVILVELPNYTDPRHGQLHT